MKRILIILVSFTLINCGVFKPKQGSVCVFEEGINNSLTKYEYSKYSKTDKFKIKGTIYDVIDSLPINNAWIILNNSPNYIETNVKGEFEVEINQQENINLSVISDFKYLNEINIVPKFGEKLEFILFLGTSDSWSTYQTKNINKLKREIRKKNREIRKLNKKFKKITNAQHRL